MDLERRIESLERKLWEQSQDIETYCTHYCDADRDWALNSLINNAQSILNDPHYQLAARIRDKRLFNK